MQCISFCDTVLVKAIMFQPHVDEKANLLFSLGGAGISAGSGGGSGGSLLLNTTYLHGDGMIDVSGGDGNSATVTAWNYWKHSQSFNGRYRLS